VLRGIGAAAIVATFGAIVDPSMRNVPAISKWIVMLAYIAIWIVYFVDGNNTVLCSWLFTAVIAYTVGHFLYQLFTGDL